MSKRNSESDKMSCTVMYQPYAMASSSSSYGVCDRPPPEKKAFRFPYVPSPPDSLHSDGSSYSHTSPGPSSLPLTATNPSNNSHSHSPLSLSLSLNAASSSSTSATGNVRRPLTPTTQILGLSGPFSSSSTAPATITSATQLLQIQHLQQPPHHPISHSHGLSRSPHSHSSSSSMQQQHRQQHHSHNNGPSSTVTSNNSSSSSNSGRGSSGSASATITSHTHPHPHSLLDQEGESQQNDENEQQQQQQQHGQHMTNVGGSGGSNRVQYLSANCVVYENYREETARVVEDHFNRALSAVTSTKCSPMSTRNFPPSFYQPQSTSSNKQPFVNMGGYSASDFYGAAVDYGSSLTAAAVGLSHHHHLPNHQPDPWHYPLTSHHHQGYHHHHRATDLTYPPMPSTSRFNAAAAAQYGSFFLAGAAATNSASRFATAGGSSGQCGTNLKGDNSTWPTALYPHPHDSISELNLADYAAASSLQAHYTNRTAAAGLETTTVGQEASGKDPYWF